MPRKGKRPAGPSEGVGQLRSSIRRANRDRFKWRDRQLPMPGYHRGSPPRNKSEQYPADPPTVEEIIAVMRTVGDRAEGNRLSALIVLLWRAGLRISEALALQESDLDRSRGAVLVRQGKGGNLQGIDSSEIISTVHGRPSPTISATAGVLFPMTCTLRFSVAPTGAGSRCSSTSLVNCGAWPSSPRSRSGRGVDRRRRLGLGECDRRRRCGRPACTRRNTWSRARGRSRSCRCRDRRGPSQALACWDHLR